MRGKWICHVYCSTCRVLQVKMVLGKLYENKKIASATHNIYAYRSVMSHEYIYIYIHCIWPNICHGFIMQILLTLRLLLQRLISAEEHEIYIKIGGLSVFSKGHIKGQKKHQRKWRLSDNIVYYKNKYMCASLSVCVFLMHTFVCSFFFSMVLMRSTSSCSCTACVVITVDI